MSSFHQASSAAAPELRLRAVVERVAPAPADDAPCQQVVQLSQPTRAADGRPIGASSVLLDHDSPWQEAGVRPGDTVLFTTTVRCVLERVQTPALQSEQGLPIRWRKVAALVLAALGGGAIGWWAGSRPMPQPTSRTAS